MKCLIQRVSQASVTVENKIIGKIANGMLVLVGFEKTDDDSKFEYHLRKLTGLRIFEDAQGKMNLSIKDTGGAFLLVSQFTLAGDCKKGMRPGFDNAKPPLEAEAMYERFVKRLREESGLKVETGRFGAMMEVSLINDGPVTFMLEY